MEPAVVRKVFLWIVFYVFVNTTVSGIIFYFVGDGLQIEYFEILSKVFYIAAFFSALATVLLIGLAVVCIWFLLEMVRYPVSKAGYFGIMPVFLQFCIIFELCRAAVFLLLLIFSGLLNLDINQIISITGKMNMVYFLIAPLFLAYRIRKEAGMQEYQKVFLIASSVFIFMAYLYARKIGMV